MKFSNLNKKILIGMLLMIISITTMGSIALYTSHAINNKTVEVMNKYTQSIELIYNIRHLTEEVVFTNLKKNEEASAIFTDKDEKKLKNLHQELEQSFQKFEQVYDNDSSILYHEFYNGWKEYLASLEKESNVNQDANARKTMRREARDQYEKVKLSLNELLDFEKKALEKLKEEQKKAYNTANRTIWGALFLFLFLGITLTLIAEETGLIIPIGEWVIRQAFLQHRLIHQLRYEPIKIGINLSVIQFSQPDLIDTVKQIITETKVDPTYLEFEITESIAMSDFNMIAERLKELKGLGVTIAMDDFGTGYSSLNYLKRLPIDTLKIDQSFIKDVEPNKHDRTLIKTIIQMAKSLNLHVVAEGVEEDVHVRLLKEENCDEAQGYYYSRPLKEEEFFRILNESSSSKALRYSV